jgi:hypothetical protein
MTDNRTLSLFSHPAPYSNRTTSRDAAKSIQKLTARWCVEVLRLISDAGANGLTCDEVIEVLGRPHQSLSPRVTQLSQSGFIVDSGTKRTTRGGRSAIVWIVSEFGKLALNRTDTAANGSKNGGTP